ncbi:hypothetical protein OIU34_21290 [Pararhizobium sp. BT-229]|uniref:hypothetical protein n=1 Tax=Pararhizobium sp. BT-229 TaxID=2986923 RepID=UPI0021F7E13E|nr:hypothetical protein [Pararhizobium sp. BT-229]MCV9964427.1 hypothetical protein [Pararhizobium sp. BT-229]
MDEQLDMPIDRAVSTWLAEELERHERSGSVRKLEPRVLARNGSAMVARRPIRRNGAYFVRWAGTAKLVSAARVDGIIVFDVSWTW